VKGIEPSYAVWETAVLPLNYTRGRRPDLYRGAVFCLRRKFIPRAAALQGPATVRSETWDCAKDKRSRRDASRLCGWTTLPANRHRMRSSDALVQILPSNYQSPTPRFTRRALLERRTNYASTGGEDHDTAFRGCSGVCQRCGTALRGGCSACTGRKTAFCHFCTACCGDDPACSTACSNCNGGRPGFCVLGTWCGDVETRDGRYGSRCSIVCTAKCDLGRKV
jgi:hypothetical protein